MIRVLVNGALGRMGGEVCKKVFAEPDLELVGAVDIKEGTIALGEGVKVSKAVRGGGFGSTGK